MDSIMTPIAVDPLFDLKPELFAYMLPSYAERERLSVDDMVKLFFELEDRAHPIAAWFVVTDINPGADGQKEFTAKNWHRNSDAMRQRLPEEVKFSSSDIYRLPMQRPEVPNPVFDAHLRLEKRAET